MGLGIDFGTTRTVVAYSDRKNYPVASFETESGDALEWFPSIVAERDGELRFGIDALAVLGDPTFAQVRSFKRLLAGSDAEASRLVTIGSVRVSVSELVAGFARALARALRERSNLPKSLRKQPSWETVIASPATAFCTQRFVTLDAFRAAGFGVRAMLNEPSAAGFEYTHRHRNTLTSRRDSVVVYDLGGGTFDASLVRMVGAHHAVLGTAGIARLGGDDFDELLAKAALDQVGLEMDALSPQALLGLLTQCRDAKERLHPNSKKIALDLESFGASAAVTVSVADFYDACMPLVERTLDAMAPVLGPASEEAAEIAGVYVVGGASELPIIARTLRERFGRRVHRSQYPSAAVAIGLAIAADESAGFALADRYSRTFGVFREGAGGQEIVYDPIFAPGTELPVHTKDPLTCTRMYRAAHNVGHFRFFECNAVDGGRPRGDMALFGDVYFPFDAGLTEAKDLARVAVQRTDANGPRICERYSLDENGIVDVLIRNVDSGYERAFRLGG